MELSEEQQEAVLDLVHALNSVEKVGLHAYVSDEWRLSLSLEPPIERMPEPESWVVVPVALAGSWVAMPGTYFKD